jgi:hypothetical protein
MSNLDQLVRDAEAGFAAGLRPVRRKFKSARGARPAAAG